MTESQVALLAACIAAMVAVLSITLTILAGRSAETKSAYRRTIEPFLPLLSEAIHSTIATSIIIGKTKTEKARQNWRNKAKSPKESLKQLCRKVKYPLWGLSDHLQVITRLPDWADHLSAAKVPFEEFDSSARGYGTSIDRTIKDAYLLGRPPKKCDLDVLAKHKE